VPNVDCGIGDGRTVLRGGAMRAQRRSGWQPSADDRRVPSGVSPDGACSGAAPAALAAGEEHSLSKCVK